jgi:mono/diheme cytochrome c family protein
MTFMKEFFMHARNCRNTALALSFVLALTAAWLLTRPTADAAKVTYTKDVAPILYAKCAACHRPGETAPMSLLSYKEVRPWAKSIREAVAKREMPPWYADPKHGEFINDRRLAQQELDTIVAWVDGGASEGDAKDLPPAPKFPPPGWSAGTPDAVFPLPIEASVPADGTVPYRHFVVHTKFSEDKFVQFAEIKRGNPAVVHHVIVTVVEPRNGQVPPEGELNSARGFGEDSAANNNQNSNNNSNTVRATNPDSMLVGWAPGMSPLMLRPGIGKLIKKGSALVFQMHYTTNGVAGTDRTAVGLTFAKAPVEKRFITTGASARNLAIPANDANYESTSSFTFREDSHIWGFMPHMHLRGKDFLYTLVLPDGTKKVLLNVPKYDFNWQLNYWLKEPVAAPKGSRLECLAHHDNSTNNKYNPDPTKTIYWGPQTWEEMMIGWFDYTLDHQNLRAPQAASSSGQ